MLNKITDNNILCLKNNEILTQQSDEQIKSFIRFKGMLKFNTNNFL